MRTRPELKGSWEAVYIRHFVAGISTPGLVRWPLRGTYSSRYSAGARTRSSPGIRNKFPIQQADKLSYQHTFLLSQLDQDSTEGFVLRLGPTTYDVLRNYVQTTEFNSGCGAERAIQLVRPGIALLRYKATADLRLTSWDYSTLKTCATTVSAIQPCQL